MRNLKRALSLALASVMLLGMMVVGSSAAFSDADEIVNKEAVEITAGLGLFAGSDGKFNPKGNVTRAQMATIITKMLYGSEINADQFKGTGKFADTVSFEGGWAEGYISLCASLGIVKGYGDGTFKPGNSVTTAEAVTMIINALKVDAGEGTWPLTVMAKSEEMELFKDLAVKPGTNEVLTRDQLAVIAWNGLNYSAEGVQGYKVSGSTIVFKTWSDAAEYYKALNSTTTVVASAITEVKGDTLADTVFGIQKQPGYITANQATGNDCTVVGGVKVNLETGLDMLGHFVTVYYKEAFQTEAKPGVAYCVVENAEYVTVAETITADKKDYLAAFAGKVEATEDISGNVVVNQFDNQGTAQGAQILAGYDETAYSAVAGTYVIDNETGKIIAYLAPIAASIEQVGRVSAIAGKETIKVGTTVYQNNEDQDEIVEYDGIAEDDYVAIKTYIDNQGNAKYYLTKLDVVSGKITKTGTVDDKAATYIDGTAYINSSLTPAASISGVTAAASCAPHANNTYDAYLYNGKLVFVKATSSTADLSAVVYVVNSYTNEVAGGYGTDTDHYYAQGVDATGKEVSILIGIEGCSETNPTTGALINTPVTSLAPGFYTFEKSLDREQAKKNVMTATPAKVLVDASNPANVFDADVDEFFAGTATTNVTNKIANTDKYVTVDSNRVYLTAETQFIVVKKLAVDASTGANITDVLEIATYTGGITKDTTGDTIAVAAIEDENGNKMASIVVINTAAVGLKSEDYVYVVSAAGDVAGGKEYNVFFTATNEFKTIVTDGTYTEGDFYGEYTIDEEGVYTLTRADYSGFEYNNEEFAGIIGTSVTTLTGNVDLFDAAEAVIKDVRSEDTLEDSEVAAIETLKDVVSAMKAGYRVFFDVLLETDGADTVVTHIFVDSVKKVKLNPDNTPMEGKNPSTGAYIEANWEEA